MDAAEAVDEACHLPECELGEFSIQFPICSKTPSQDEEWCIVRCDGSGKRIRFHDYDELYKIPGLYEHLFYEKLQCNSPETVCSLLKREVAREPVDLSDFVVLDVGAGNGMVGKELVDMGVEAVVGVDIIQEAAEATERDRPGIYKDYYVVDLTNLPHRVQQELEAEDFNCLTTVAALGFGDIPPLAFAQAYNLIAIPGWVAFNIKDAFLSQEDSSGFSRLIHRMVETGILDIRECRRYRHRVALDGTPLHYFAVVAVKEADIPMAWVE